MFAQFQADDRFTSLQGTTEGETIIATNNEHEALSDVRVRRAIMHAVDRQAVIDAVEAGHGTPIGQSLPAPPSGLRRISPGAIPTTRRRRGRCSRTRATATASSSRCTSRPRATRGAAARWLPRCSPTSASPRT